MALDAPALQRVHEATIAGDLSALRSELEPLGDFPNAVPSPAIGTLLVYAVHHGPIELIEGLLDAGADPDADDGDGFPPLIAALSPPGRDDVAAVLALLLDRGADIERRGINDYASLHAAAAAGRLDLVDLLLERGADPDAITHIDDMETPLDIAETAGHEHIAERLRPLTTLPDWIRASTDGDVMTLARMLAAGHDVNRTDGHRQTALMRASLHGNLQAVELLIGEGAALDHTAKFGLSALMLAAINGRVAVGRALVRAGADTSLVGSGGFAKTAAELADHHGHGELADFIREHGR